MYKRQPFELSHFRDRNGAEVDVVIDTPRGVIAVLAGLLAFIACGVYATNYSLWINGRTGGGAVELEISKGDLASLLGTIPETLSRILAKMNRQGLIRSRGAQIGILDREGLERIAEGVKKLP